MPQLIVTPLNVAKSYYEATGCVLHQWALLEFYMEKIICLLLHRIGPKEGRLIFSQMNARAKIEVYRALVDKKVPEGEVKKLAQFIGKHAPKLSELRNKIVHGRWSHPVNKPRTIVLYYVGGSSENRWMPKSYRTTAKNVLAIGGMIEKLNQSANRIISALRVHLPLPDISREEPAPGSPPPNGNS